MGRTIQKEYLLFEDPKERSILNSSINSFSSPVSKTSGSLDGWSVRGPEVLVGQESLVDV